MSVVLDPERRPIPRWRPWRITARLGLLDSIRGASADPNRDLTDLEKSSLDWRRHRTLAHAGDFLGAAFAEGHGHIARDAAEFVLQQGSSGAGAARALAERVVAGESPGTQIGEPPRVAASERGTRISRLRRHLREWPRDTLAWMDIAREYTILGRSDLAAKPIEIALALAPHSRFVVRSASRFYLHAEDRERAHYILRRSKHVTRDPWVLSAEIAVAGAVGRTSRLIKLARQMLADRSIAPEHLSELASAVGTVEIEAGNRRSSRRFFQTALLSPTENSVAQAEWATRRISDLGLEPVSHNAPLQYEADAWNNLTRGAWERAVSFAQLWLRDEPFSSRPAEFGSWAASITMGDFESARQFAQAGLVTNPDGFLLLNNLAVALASLGRADEAKEVFGRIGPLDRASKLRATYLATAGLISYRLGDPAEGRVLYRQAVQNAAEFKTFREKAWALLHFAREEFRFDGAAAQQILEEAHVVLDGLPARQRAIAECIERQIGDPRKAAV